MKLTKENSQKGSAKNEFVVLDWFVFCLFFGFCFLFVFVSIVYRMRIGFDFGFVVFVFCFFCFVFVFNITDTDWFLVFRSITQFNYWPMVSLKLTLNGIRNYIVGNIRVLRVSYN